MARLPEPSRGAIAFQYLAEIAVGETARVDLCRALDTDRKGQLLAVKRLHPHIAEDPGFHNQFMDEVWLTSALKHPNVVEVTGWGTDDQGLYLAVELVQGVSLARLMKTVFDTGEVFTERMVVFVASRLCSGLAAAHALRSPEGELLNLVHRDLTPSNVLVGFNGDVKIADFGLAKAKQRLTKTLTGLLKGEPQYMAPEQARGTREIDGRADLFSLGILLFELFAGRKPWLASNDFEMVQLTAKEPPTDLRELRPKIDKELAAVVHRCLEKEPGARFQNAAEIAARLDEWLEVHGYQEGNEEALARFVRRNAMRQMRWFERAVAGELAPTPEVVAPPQDLLPRVPSYTNLTSVPIRRAPRPGAPPLPVSPPRSTPNPPAPIFPPRPSRESDESEDLTDVTDPRKLGGYQGKGPLIREIEDEVSTQDTRRRPSPSPSPSMGKSQAEIDWGEEVPTLVQKESAERETLRAQARAKMAANAAAKGPVAGAVGALKAAVGGALRAAGRGAAIADEESDARTTAVRGNPLADQDSEEGPTLPVQTGQAKGMAADAAAGRLRVLSKPPSPAAPRIASAPRPGGLPAASAPPAPQGPPGRLAPPMAGLPQLPVERGAGPPSTRRNGAQDEGAALAPDRARGSFASVPWGNEPPSQDQEPASSPPPPPPSRWGATPSPMPNGNGHGAGRGEPTTPIPSPSPSRPQAPVTSEDMLLAEADRLAIEAVRRSEEAEAAAVRAERKGAIAKVASDAALIAAEAVRLVGTSGLAAAVQRLEEARSLEKALQSGAIPLPGAATGKQPRSGLAPSSFPSPSPSSRGDGFPSSFPSPPSPPSSRDGFSSSRPRLQSIPPQSFPLPPHLPSVPVPARPSFFPLEPPPPTDGMADALAFQGRLRSTAWGMSNLAVVGMAAGAFFVVLLLLWLIWG